MKSYRRILALLLCLLMVCTASCASAATKKPSKTFTAVPTIRFTKLPTNGIRSGTMKNVTISASVPGFLNQYLTDMDGNPRSDLVLPSLAEYIRICKKYDKQSILELKNHMEPEHIAGIVEIIRTEGWLERTTFISFDLPNMLCLRQLLPQQPLQYLVSAITDDLLDTLVSNRLDLDIRFPNLTREFLDACHQKGVEVNVWTVDTVDNALRLADWGVDYITSNILE